MTITAVLAVVPVKEIPSARDWYSKLFGRAPDNQPMNNLVEWQVHAGSWVQVFVDPVRAGSGLLNFAVDDLPSELEQLQQRGLHIEAVEEANKGVQLCSLRDTDGNVITLIGNFRTSY